jgi:hypothetical protein
MIGVITSLTEGMDALTYALYECACALVFDGAARGGPGFRSMSAVQKYR